MASDERNRQMACLQDEIKTLEVRVEEQKRKAVEANLKLAQATRIMEKMERDLCLDSLKGDGRLLLDKRLAIVAGLLTATINDFAELKKRFAEDSDVAAVAGLKKMLADLRTELKREKTEHASAKSGAKKATEQLLLVTAQRDQSDEKIIGFKNEIRRLKERLETMKSTTA